MNQRLMAKIERQLEGAERTLRETLISELRHASPRSQSMLFFNSRFNPNDFSPAHLSLTAEQLLQSAEQCVAWREALGLEVKGSVGQLYMAACEELTSRNPHGRGPEKLVGWLLNEVNQAHIHIV